MHEQRGLCLYASLCPRDRHRRHFRLTRFCFSDSVAVIAAAQRWCFYFGGDELCVFAGNSAGVVRRTGAEPHPHDRRDRLCSERCYS